MSDALLNYVMGSNPEQVDAARKNLNTEIEAGGRPLNTRKMTFAEQRRAGMAPPSQRLQENTIPGASKVSAGALAKLDDDTFYRLRDMLEDEGERRLNELDVSDEEPDEPSSEDLAHAETVAMAKHVEARAEADARQLGGKTWESGTGKWQRGEIE